VPPLVVRPLASAQPPQPRVSRGLPLYIYIYIYIYICTSLNVMQSSNSSGIYFPTWYHEVFLLLLLSRARCRPTSFLGHQSPSPLLSLWTSMTLQGLQPSRAPPIYSSMSLTRWLTFRPLRRSLLSLTPACTPSPSSSKKKRIASLP
jgi:hypothetical protein